MRFHFRKNEYRAFHLAKSYENPGSRNLLYHLKIRSGYTLVRTRVRDTDHPRIERLVSCARHRRGLRCMKLDFSLSLFTISEIHHSAFLASSLASAFLQNQQSSVINYVLSPRNRTCNGRNRGEAGVDENCSIQAWHDLHAPHQDNTG